MDNIILRYVPLPTTTKGLTVRDETGDYNIYLNARLAYEANAETLQHEIKHIIKNDFARASHVREIEK